MNSSNQEWGRRLASAAGTAISAARLEAAPSLASLVDILQEVIGFEHLSVVAIEGDRWRQVLSTEHPELRPQSDDHPLKGTLFATAAATGEPVLVEETQSASGLNGLVLSPRVNSMVILPLAHEGHVIAGITVGFAEPEIPTPKVMEVLSAVGATVGQAVRHLVEFEKQRQTIRRLEELDRARSDFLGMVAHDMRSPVAVIAGFSDQLASMWDELPDAERRRFVGAIRRSAQGLRLFVDNALQLAQLEAGRFSYEIAPFDLVALVGSAVETVAGDQIGRVTLNTEGDLRPALGDERRHWQIAANLLSNALKFSPSGAPIVLRIARDGEMLRVSVRDRGPGIADADVGIVFDKFARLDRDQSQPGAGLGLYMCKEMVEAQGGQIWVESRRDEGSTFIYTVPSAR